MKIRRCHGYTLQEECPICGERTVIARPPRFSPEDRYGKYRRRLKRELKTQSKQQL